MFTQRTPQVRSTCLFPNGKKYRSSLQSKERFSRHGGKVPVFSPAAFRQWKGSGVKHLPFSYGKSTGVLYRARSGFPATAGKALGIMGKGMLGIFVVIVVIALLVYLLTKITSRKKS